MKTYVHTDADLKPRLTRALLIYEHHETAFVTVHEMRSQGGRTHMGPGVPASRPALAKLAQRLANATALSGFLPPQLLYMSPRVIAWHRAAAPATMFFDGDGERAKVLGTRRGIAAQPGLVFTVTATDWYVWAVSTDATSARPDAATPLFRAPHFNVWKDGKICTGNVKLPETMNPEVLGKYEAAFFGSNFTHPNDPQGLTRHPKGPYALWRDLLDGKPDFPATWLSPLKKTLSAAIKELEAAGDR